MMALFLYLLDFMESFVIGEEMGGEMMMKGVIPFSEVRQSG